MTKTSLSGTQKPFSYQLKATNILLFMILCNPSRCYRLSGFLGTKLLCQYKVVSKLKQTHPSGGRGRDSSGVPSEKLTLLMGYTRMKKVILCTVRSCAFQDRLCTRRMSRNKISRVIDLSVRYQPTRFPIVMPRNLAKCEGL